VLKRKEIMTLALIKCAATENHINGGDQQREKQNCEAPHGWPLFTAISHYILFHIHAKKFS
jgi:hypothetical protein